MNNYTDDKRFWDTVKPLFSNYYFQWWIAKNNSRRRWKYHLEWRGICENIFVESVKSLNINANKDLLNPTVNLTDPVDIALKKFENHPSILGIKEHVSIEAKLSFSKVETSDISIEIRNLDIKKAGTFSNIIAKQLKQFEQIIAEPLIMDIWNIDNKKFPSKLEYADLPRIFKKFECVFKKIIDQLVYCQ